MILDDRPILRDVTIEIGDGLTIVRGPNGAGKTTLLRTVAGLVPLARGSLHLSGPALYIGHRPMLLRGLTARENLSFYSRFRGVPTSAIADALRRWGITAEMDRPVERLSAGERRRASLARLDTEPTPVVLLDEPFADLDDDAVARLDDAVRRLSTDGRAVVVATHAHHELDALARARLDMSDGVATTA